MGTDLTLDRFQRWMQAVLTHPGTDEEAFESETAQTEMPLRESLNFVVPSRTLSSIERVGIYKDMYFLRLYDAIKMDYETVCHFLGEKKFRNLIKEYIKVYPSRSYNMNRLSDNLPEYIRTRSDITRNEFLSDLARLELAMSHIMDSEESPVLTKETIASVPNEVWENAKLKPIEAFRLLSFRYPVNAYLQSVRDEEPSPKMGRKDSFVLVFRKDYVVWRWELSRQQHDLLQALAEGKPLGEAIITVTERYPGKSNTWSKHLFKWFNDWISDGIFQSIEL